MSSAKVQKETRHFNIKAEITVMIKIMRTVQEKNKFGSWAVKLNFNK